MASSYYRVIRTKKLIDLLVRSGFTPKDGAKHGKYEREGNVIIVPRHRTISPGTSKQICDELEKRFAVPAAELRKLF